MSIQNQRKGITRRSLFLQIFFSRIFGFSQLVGEERRTSRDWTSFETRRSPARDQPQMFWSVWRRWRPWPGRVFCPFEWRRESHILPQSCGGNRRSNPRGGQQGK